MSNDDYVLPPKKGRKNAPTNTTSINNMDQSEENPLLAQGEVLNANKEKTSPKKAEEKQLKDEIISKNTGKKLKKYIAPYPQNYNQGNNYNPKEGYNQRNNYNSEGEGKKKSANYNPNSYERNKNTKNPKSQKLRGNVKLPEMSFGMYFSGYLFWMIIIIYNLEIGTFWKMLLVIYTLVSNYTYCWYAEYQRLNDGSFSWLFSKNWGLKAGGLFALAFRTFFIGIIFILLLEFIKLAITIPIAFVTVFTHKMMMKKYE